MSTFFNRMGFILQGIVVCSLVASVARAADAPVGAADQTKDFAVRNLSFSPRQLDLSRKVHKATVSLLLDRAAEVSVRLEDWDGDLILEKSQSFEAGRASLEIDLTEAKGKLYDGPALFSVALLSKAGLRAHYSPGFASGLEYLSIEKREMDVEKGLISFVMPQLGMVRVRLRGPNALLIRTVNEWTPMLGGAQQVVWDGNDQSGYPINRKTAKLHTDISAYTLPENAFIMAGIGAAKPARPLEAQYAWQRNPLLKKKYYHARIPREQSRDPKLRFEFLGPDGTTRLQPPVKLAEKMKVRLDSVDAIVARNAINEGFEICIFVDGVMIFEDEDGLFPFNFELDPKSLNPGEHMLSVLAITTCGHVGVASASFVVPTPDAAQAAPTANEKKAGE